jgi:hypothetical protein
VLPRLPWSPPRGHGKLRDNLALKPALIEAGFFLQLPPGGRCVDAVKSLTAWGVSLFNIFGPKQLLF